MKFGVREICDVVLKAKTAQKVGKKVFYKNEPVLYFDTLKTSTLEGASSTVYAQGGRGNARLVAWEGERTVTFTMEDALISPEGFSILTGAGLVDGEETPVIMHTTEQTDNISVVESGSPLTKSSVVITLSEEPYLGNGTFTESSEEVTINNATDFDAAVKQFDLYTSTALTTQVTTYTSGTTKYYKKIKTFSSNNPSEDFIYIMHMTDGLIDSEPYIPSELTLYAKNGKYSVVTLYADESSLQSDDYSWLDYNNQERLTAGNRKNDLSIFKNGDVVFADYYTARTTGAYQVNITPDKFGGNYYLEASTLFRDTNGTDLPAEFIIPNCKIQSAFTFSMASTGDPSTFTFTMDAFPDYTRWDKTKKVFAAIQVFDVGAIGADLDRLGTVHNNSGIVNDYNKNHKPFIEV